MAVAFSNPVANNVTVAATTNSFAFDNGSGSNRSLAVHVGTTSTTLSSGATYNGTALTRRTQNNASFISEIYTWPDGSEAPSGSNTLTVTFPSNQQSLVIACRVTGVDSADPTGAANSSVGGIDTTPDIAITTEEDNSGVFIGLSSNLGTSVTDLADQTRLQDNVVGGMFATYASYEIRATAGAHTFGYTQSSTQGCCSAVEFKEAAAPAGPTNLKTWNGLAKASIKTIDGLAIASIKTWNGLT